MTCSRELRLIVNSHFHLEFELARAAEAGTL
jgi:hypothetical protein